MADATLPIILPERRQGRRRDRRERGLRGPLLPPNLPAHRSRAQRFDDHVRAAIARLSHRWERQLRRIQVAVEDIPPSETRSWEGGPVLGRAFPAANGLPGRIVLYRRPIESRALPGNELALLILDVLVEELAHLLGRDPREIDPGYDRD